MILVDTSVWVDHLRAGNQRLSSLLQESLVCVHPFVVGELACGNLPKRSETLGALRRMPIARCATDDEVLFYIEEQRLMGRGIGFVDAHLLAAAALSGSTSLWTQDKRLAALANELGVGLPA